MNYIGKKLLESVVCEFHCSCEQIESTLGENASYNYTDVTLQRAQTH